MTAQDTAQDTAQESNDFIANVSGRYSSKKSETVYIIIYPDGSKGELNMGAIVLL